MSSEQFSISEKDELLHEALQVLARRGVVLEWANMGDPYSRLVREFKLVMEDDFVANQILEYLKTRPYLRRTVNMCLSNIGMVLEMWPDTLSGKDSTMVYSWFIGRWLPAFLIIDGPVGRFLKLKTSPLSTLLEDQDTKYMVIYQIRDLLNSDLFKRLRNGFGHWSFDWEVVNGISYVVAFDGNTGKKTAKLSQKEADAFQIVAFAVMEILNNFVFIAR